MSGTGELRDRHGGLAIAICLVWRVGAACSGKLLNVRDASLTTVSANAEIQNIKQIMGLQHGKVGY